MGFHEVKGELPRQLYHLGNGLVITWAVLRWGRPVGLVLVLLSAAGLILSLRYKDRQVPFLEPVIRVLDRPEDREKMPGRGAILYGAAVGLTALLFPPLPAAGGVAVLAAGDAASTIVGKGWGRHPLPWNKRLSVEGSLGFVIPATLLLSSFLSFGIALAAAVAGALVETIPWGIDDNVTIPLSVGLLLWLLVG